MKANKISSILLNKEVWLHTILWILFFISINVYWTKSWIGVSFLPEFVAPHIALSVPIIFLLNVFWLIPKFLSKKRWIRYVWLSLSLLIGFEIIRTLIFTIALQGDYAFIDVFKRELFGDNSIIFGTLNVLTLNSVFYSFVYRFTRDWLISQSIIKTLQFENKQLQLTALQGANSVGFNALKFKNSEISTTENKPIKKTLAVKKRDGIFLLSISEVMYFQAQGDFVFAFDTDNKKHVINESLKTIKELISQESFFQINRSELVNFNYIIKFKSYTKNRLELFLKNNEGTLYTSNSRTPEFRLWIENH